MSGTLADLRRELQFLRHLRPRQVGRRVLLTGKHQILARTGARFARPRPPATFRGGLPCPLFPPRPIPLELADDRIRLTFIGATRTLPRPVPWTLPDLPEDLLWKMNLHYMEYLETLDDDALVALVRDWIAGNPPYRPGYWAGIWHPYSLSIRLVVWLQQMARRAALAASFRQEAAASLGQQAGFLARNLETDIGGNHLIKNVKALLFAAAGLEHPDRAAWRRLALRHLGHELEAQILADGMHFERSPSYHAQVFADLLECRQVLGEDPLRPALDAALDRMAAACRALAHPDGGPALFNDSGLHMAHPPACCLDAHARVRGTARAPAPPSLPAAGYYGFRAGATFFLADCGPIAPDHLPAHGHGDILSFEWSVDGHRVVVDQGVVTYRAGPDRQTARSAAAHNTVTVGDADQADFFGAFRMGRRARARCRHHRQDDGALELEGSHDGFRHLPGGPVPVRRFEVTARRVAIADRVEGGAGQPVRARLLLHPDWEVALAGGRALLRRGRSRIEIEASAPFVLEPAPWWPDPGVERPTRRLVVVYGAAPARGHLHLRVL